MACAGILVGDAGGELVPRRLVKRPAGSKASLAYLTAGDAIERRQVPQPDGLVRATGGQDVSVGGKRHAEHPVGVAGEGSAELSGSVTVGQLPQPDGLVSTGSCQGVPVRTKSHGVHEVGVAGQGLAESGSVTVTEIPQPA